MLLSMTGYGRAINTFQDKTITVEVRSLNSKFTDLRVKSPQNYRDKEHTIRKIVTAQTQRGKIDITIDVKSSAGDGEFALNKSLFRKYHQELTGLTQSLGIQKGDIIQSILRLPNVVAPDEATVDDEEWTAVEKTIQDAINTFTAFRKEEGMAMERDCTNRINHIIALLDTLAPHEKERIEKLKAKINRHMEEYVGKDNIDANRFEQEILYYLEKMDVTEEKVRLAQHCKYFLEELDSEKTLKGKKLSFISQEMGREINTLGSKANSSAIQHIVVVMKDELEKIKEQVLNTI
ncbi:MAG: YicC/YloC family endoribonuclease [Saprospiraceae bacterium]